MVRLRVRRLLCTQGAVVMELQNAGFCWVAWQAGLSEHELPFLYVCFQNSRCLVVVEI